MTPFWGIWSAETGWRMLPTSISPAGFPGFKRTESEAGAPELPCGLSAWELGGAPVSGAAAKGAELGGRMGCGDPLGP